jgi:hypothetical protein
MFGGGSKVRSFWSLLSLIFLSVSSGLTIMGVITESKSTDPNAYWALPYVIPSAIMNVICVILLVYLVATLKGKSNFYKLLVTVLLVSGLVAEVYMTTLLDMTNKGQEAGTWIVIILNWLFRAFYVLEFVQEEWTPLFPAAKDVAKAVSTSTSTSSSTPTEPTDKGKELVKKWEELLVKIREANGGKDKIENVGEGFKVISDARKSGTFDMAAVLASAKSKIKRKDGAALIGGRR